MKLFRQLWAWLWGYFWLPCDLCGRMFGGYEAAETGWINKGRIVCWRCEEKVQKQNKQDCEDGKIPYYFTKQEVRK